MESSMVNGDRRLINDVADKTRANEQRERVEQLVDLHQPISRASTLLVQQHQTLEPTRIRTIVYAT